jgi:hypothetical protein
MHLPPADVHAAPGDVDADEVEHAATRNAIGSDAQRIPTA